MIGLLLAIAAQAASCTEPVYLDAIRYQARGDAARVRGKWIAADQAYARGIERLGMRYWPPQGWPNGMPIDDTGKALSLANADARKKSWRSAAGMHRGVLSSRLGMYRRGRGCQ